MDLFDLVAKITVDTSDFNDKIDQAAESAEGLSGVIDSLAGGVLQGLADGLREAAEAGEDIEALDDAVSNLAQGFVSGEQSGKEFLSSLADMAKEAKESKGDLKDVAGKTEDVGDAEEKASKKTKVFGDMLKANLVSSAVTKGLGLLVSGIKKLGSAFTDIIPKLAEYGDHIDKQSQKMGISAKAYQEWDAVMRHSGTTVDSAIVSMKTLANAVTSGSDETANALDTLGISLEHAAGMSQEDLFSEVITGLQNMEAGTERTALATKLLGRGAMEMGALLNTSAADTQAMKDRVNELGGVLSDTAVKDAAVFQDSLQDLQTALQGLQNEMGAVFLPGFTQVMDGVTDILAGNIEGGQKTIRLGVDDVLKNLRKTAPNVIKTVGTLLDAGMDAITENVDAITDTLADVAIMAIEGLAGMLPRGAQAGMDILIKLLERLAEHSEELGAALTDVALAGITAMANPENLARLVAATFKLVVGIFSGVLRKLGLFWQADALDLLSGPLIADADRAEQGVSKAANKMVKDLKDSGNEMVRNAEDTKAKVSGLTDTIQKILNDPVLNASGWGSDLVKNFTDGMQKAKEQVTRVARNIANEIRNYLGFSEPKEGPLSDFHTYAPDMMDLFIKGIRDNEDALKRQIASTFAFDDVSAPAIQGVGVNGYAAGIGQYTGGNISINVYGAQGQDVETLADLVADKVSNIIYTTGERRAMALG